MPRSARSAAIFLLLLLALSTGPALAAGSPSHSSPFEDLVSRGEYDRALEGYQKDASLYPYDQTVRRNLTFAYARVADRELKLGRYSEAANYYGQACELTPGNTDLRLMLGVSLYLDKKYDAARSELAQAGEGVKPLAYLGKISYDTGDLPAALALWRRALEQDPGEKAIRSLIEKAERELPVESKMDKGYSSMFDLSFDAELPQGIADEVLDTLERAYNSVGADLGLFPATRIPVLLYAKQDYSSVTGGPEWSGGLYDGKIRLPVGGVTKLTPQMRATLFHEFTHVLVVQLTGGNIPTWFNEGLAEIEGRKEFAHPAPELLRAAEQGKLLSFSALSGSFASMTGAEATLAYQQSYSLTHFLVSRYGWYAVQGILKSLGERATMEAAVAKALSDWSMGLQDVVGAWRESVPAVAGTAMRDAAIASH